MLILRFIIEVARRHPAILAPLFLQHFTRTDLNLQHGLSLMVIVCYLMVGRYALAFLNVSEIGSNQVFAGAFLVNTYSDHGISLTGEVVGGVVQAVGL
jgi:hypothetical protein